MARKRRCNDCGGAAMCEHKLEKRRSSDSGRAAMCEQASGSRLSRPELPQSPTNKRRVQLEFVHTPSMGSEADAPAEVLRLLQQYAAEEAAAMVSQHGAADSWSLRFRAPSEAEAGAASTVWAVRGRLEHAGSSIGFRCVAPEDAGALLKVCRTYPRARTCTCKHTSIHHAMRMRSCTSHIATPTTMRLRTHKHARAGTCTRTSKHARSDHNYVSSLCGKGSQTEAGSCLRPTRTS